MSRAVLLAPGNFWDPPIVTVDVLRAIIEAFKSTKGSLVGLSAVGTVLNHDHVSQKESLIAICSKDLSEALWRHIILAAALRSVPWVVGLGPGTIDILNELDQNHPNNQILSGCLFIPNVTSEFVSLLHKHKISPCKIEWLKDSNGKLGQFAPTKASTVVKQKNTYKRKRKVYIKSM